MAALIRQLAANDTAFAHCFAMRFDVFVGEQNVPPEEERDGFDDIALHFLALQNGAAVGTARVLMDATGIAKIGRVAVPLAWRGRGLGAALIEAVERELPLARGYALDAQVQALAFYERLGYAAFGEVFIEAGIAHRRMTKPAG